jgi:phosphohistidine phosphatase
MELLVIRHGIAVERAPDADESADAARPLTTRGRRRFKRAVRGLGRLGLVIDHALTSPKRRALETAELLRPVLVDRDHLHTTPLLAGPPRAELLSEIAALGSTRVAVVGHEPHLGALLALLTMGVTDHGEALELKKGAVAWITGTPAPAGMRLLAVLPPKVLRRIRR